MIGSTALATGVAIGVLASSGAAFSASVDEMVTALASGAFLLSVFSGLGYVTYLYKTGQKRGWITGPIDVAILGTALGASVWASVTLLCLMVYLTIAPFI